MNNMVNVNTGLGMMVGMGLASLLVTCALVLGIAALVKYLKSNPK
ncbi:MAG: hypothetical protein ABI440_11030 [Casimicrobiaceae bacterium]